MPHEKRLAIAAETGIVVTYSDIHQVIGEGNFVLTMADGQFGDRMVAV